ncbi:RnfABCDGE type electron transport complex subunit D [Candidatus Endoriftia persephone]|jgi:electron transport complex protein RnfD|uniref:Ion-translocating oxidoreductase complex subunit D n=3 Tax=Gammaproteobacteria TaxID=1236 RepID=G2FGL1_9GAMM|nr:RnfABCDGE type electron transport complex subunit D [Candidatus Endoriftia persephone]EGV52916.1 electron transport complex protein RnfD [endosymbiont of Riftia pachyptila (vent Ph05)]EGW54122.1 electron transport complex protein RnfD [endosymbiont of Tevnia jerichonana (vent Tica)]USF87623.1 RnfABCDGE type electron transport complex subunit D [Candidatus Endoriftia persephone]
MKQQRDPKLLVQPAPLLAQGMTTPSAMRDVWYALLPATLAGLWFFGLSALLVLLACIAGAVMVEWVFTPAESRKVALGDGSAALTGLLLGLTLPPALPLWQAFLGGMVAIGLGKVIWGGLGNNLFNPALVGRAFLLGTFPIAMTTWYPAQGPEHFFDLYSSTFAAPLMQGTWDSLTTASPLGMMKFEHQSSEFWSLFIGNTAGSLGETSGLLLMLGGLWLWWRRDLDWRIPVSIFVTAGLFSLILFMVDSARFPSPLFTLFSGGMMLGAIYMATDPVTSPLSPKGLLIFGTGIGFLVVLIRVFGGMPEGMMYAILLMNSATPLIDRYTQPRVFGRGVERS